MKPEGKGKHGRAAVGLVGGATSDAQEDRGAMIPILPYVLSREPRSYSTGQT